MKEIDADHALAMSFVIAMLLILISSLVIIMGTGQSNRQQITADICRQWGYSHVIKTEWGDYYCENEQGDDLAIYIQGEWMVAPLYEVGR